MIYVTVIVSDDTEEKLKIHSTYLVLQDACDDTLQRVQWYKNQGFTVRFTIVNYFVG